MKNKLILSLTFVSLLFNTNCSSNSIDDKTIIVGASPTPHALILEQTRSYLKSKGYTLEIKQYDDYIMPNVSLNEGEIDANYFQHLPYLETYNKKNNTNLVSALKVHYEPLSIYEGKSNSLKELKNKTIGLDNDSSNCARSLYLLEALNILVNLDHDKGFTLTEKDVTSNQNPYNVTLQAFEAASLPSKLSELDFAIINGNYASSAKIPNSKILGSEEASSSSAFTYGNIIAVKKENIEKESIKVLVEALSQKEITKYINETFEGNVISLINN